MTELIYQTLENPVDEPAVQTVLEGLRRHNRAVLGDPTRCTLAVVVRDGETVVGGVWGELEWDWLHVHILWVDDDRRGRGIGSALMRAIESVALERGTDRCHLETTSFQALPFYEGLGYEVFAELEKPIGHRCFYLQRVGLG